MDLYSFGTFLGGSTNKVENPHKRLPYVFGGQPHENRVYSIHAEIRNSKYVS
jgi:hypothetical protein